MAKYVRLHCTEGGSDKLYDIHLEDRPNGTAIVYGMNGRRGSTLVRQDKTSGAIPYAAALRIYESLKAEKMGKKHYRLVNETDSVTTASAASFVVQEIKIDAKTGNVSTKMDVIQPAEPVVKKVILLPQLLNVITEEEVMRLIEDDAYMMQEKKDGERRPVISESEIIMGLNKKGTEVILPELIVKSLPKGIRIAIDGEAIADKLYAFDLLMKEGKSLREFDAERRYKLLKEISFGKNIEVVYTAFTTEEKRKLYISLRDGNKEGVVFKKKNSAYKSGRPNSGGDHLKYQFRKRASFIVDNITAGKRSVGLVILDEGKRVSIGKCTIPANYEIPKIGDVVEAQYLYAYRGGSIFQPVYYGKRNDVDAEECLISQLVYKAEEEE